MQEARNKRGYAPNEIGMGVEALDPELPRLRAVLRLPPPPEKEDAPEPEALVELRGPDRPRACSSMGLSPT